MKLKYTKEAFQTDEKRFYVPGLVVTHTCDCGKELEKDYSETYFSYPRLNAMKEAILYCEDCGTEHQFIVELSFDVKMVKV